MREESFLAKIDSLRNAIVFDLSTTARKTHTLGEWAPGFETTVEALESALFRELRFAEKQVATYPNNATLVAFYQSEIDRITAELADMGLLELADAGPNINQPVPTEQQVITVTINKVHAEAGGVKASKTVRLRGEAEKMVTVRLR